MNNPVLTAIALVRRLARQLTGRPLGDAQVHPSGGASSRSYRSSLTASFAGVVVYAAVPQCGSAQAPLAEPAQAPAAESAQVIEPESSPIPEPDSNPALESDSNPALASESEATVSALLDAMQANDADGIRALFDDNASQAYGDGPAKSGEAFFRWLDSDIIQREGRVENAQLAVDGNAVVVTGQYQSRGYSSAANFLMTVENGRITSWRMRY